MVLSKRSKLSSRAHGAHILCDLCAFVREQNNIKSHGVTEHTEVVSFVREQFIYLSLRSLSLCSLCIERRVNVMVLFDAKQKGVSGNGRK